MPYSTDFCATCNRLRISATGKLHLCLFADQGLDIRPALQSIDSIELQAQLVTLLGDKEATHWLQDGFTGATKHFPCFVVKVSDGWVCDSAIVLKCNNNVSILNGLSQC
jgi:molybdenum cofactor biosynthesis enzyme MoaA